MFYSSGGKKISCYNCHKTCFQLRTRIIYGTSFTGLYIPNTFPIDGLISVWSYGFNLFQSRIPKWLLSDSKAVKTCKDKKRSSIVNEAMKAISSQFFFYERFSAHKTQIKPKPTNKTKTSEQKQQRQQIFTQKIFEEGENRLFCVS